MIATEIPSTVFEGVGQQYCVNVLSTLEVYIQLLCVGHYAT